MARKPSTTGAVASPKKSAAVVSASAPDNPRMMSAAQLAKTLGRARDTIDRWISSGCPVVRRADRAAGIDWQLDIAAVVKWRERKVAEEAVDVAEGDDGGLGDPSTLMSTARMQIKLNAERRMYVRRTMAIATMNRANGLTRQAVMALPHRFMDLFPPIDDAEVRGKTFQGAVDLCIDALTEGAKEIQKFEIETEVDEDEVDFE